MKAVGKFILIEIDHPEDMVKKGDIYIPHHAIENSKLATGKVMSVGEKCKLGIVEGQHVLFDKHAINKYNDSIGALAEDNIVLIEK